MVSLIRGSLPGKTIAIRSDMDALPIQEENETIYKSNTNGKMHACGHDGHIAIVLGVAYLLHSKRKSIKGNVKLIFQPAEEVTPLNKKNLNKQRRRRILTIEICYTSNE